ncbi:bifunctional diaminohydroxyphosphoribosylaminopyrimidine deaminase/5-amino-6-(5-phosphoribosylamino)uracil reductase RibD [Salegentibacter sp. F14]
MNIHEKYIKRCIQLAQNGRGTTYPNPMVGSVIVYQDKIIGEGWHRYAGEPHAEVLAINAVQDQALLKDSTIYVSLEPCSHYGKTPPCSDLIIAKGIRKVVIGSVDPFSEVSGRGIKKLLEAGCKVKVGVLEDQCQWLNRRFFTYHQQRRPYIILKWAQSQDAFIAPEKQEKREPVWITNPHSNQLVHKWRSQEQSIMVGTQTAVADNPKLSTRLWDGPDPVRIALDRQLRIPRDSALFDGSIKTIIITENNHKIPAEDNLIFESIDFQGDIPREICEVLYRHQIQSVIIEGGAKTLQTFIDAGLWDEARVFTGKTQLKKGIKAPVFSGKIISEKDIESDNLKIYTND